MRGTVVYKAAGRLSRSRQRDDGVVGRLYVSSGVMGDIGFNAEILGL
jgi:hypothetical protein